QQEEPPRRAGRAAKRRGNAEFEQHPLRSGAHESRGLATTSRGFSLLWEVDMRVAAIDIGTNTVLLLVAEMRDGKLVAVEEHATITRLGQGVDKTRTLAPEAVERTNTCFDRYAEITKRCGVAKVDVVGTSAMRDAGG